MFAQNDKVMTSVEGVRVRGVVVGARLVPNAITRDMLRYIALDVWASDREALIAKGYKFPVVIVPEAECKKL